MYLYLFLMILFIKNYKKCFLEKGVQGNIKRQIVCRCLIPYIFFWDITETYWWLFNELRVICIWLIPCSGTVDLKWLCFQTKLNYTKECNSWLVLEVLRFQSKSNSLCWVPEDKKYNCSIKMSNCFVTFLFYYYIKMINGYIFFSENTSKHLNNFIQTLISLYIN